MRTRSLRAAVVVVALGAAAVSISAQTLVVPGTAFNVLENYLESARQQAGIPGMSALVLNNDVIVWDRGFGFQNVAARIRPTGDTPYLVGDLSQTLAAILLLQCVEQRRLDLDQPFNRYPLSILEDGATLRGVLSHQTSLGGDQPFSYSPGRYDQLTQVMEWCAPQPYRKSIAHRLLNHLAMRDSVPGTDLVDPDLPLPDGLFDLDDLARYRTVLSRIAVPYKVDSKGHVDRADLPVVTMSAAGGLVSTTRDLAKLDQVLDADGLDGGLLLNETRQLAWTPATGRDLSVLPTGLGWFVQSYRNERVVWHFGYVPGAYSALMLKLPDRGVTFILLANSDGLSAPFDLQSGDVTKSIFAQIFLRWAIR
jgi:CubicO group peptidase (beta-lactamase class C family)